MKKLLHTGRNLCDAQKYENAIWSLHPNDTPLMTIAEQNARRVSEEYAKWSEANPGHSKESGKKKYQEIYSIYSK